MEILLKKYWAKKKKLSLLSFSFVLLSFISFSQETQSVKLVKERTQADFWPRISSFHNGEIPFSEFSSAEGIVTTVGYEVFSFEINFGDLDQKPTRVFGNVIPNEICAEIKVSGLNQPVYFSNIKAIAPNGKLMHLNSFRLIPVKDEK